MFDERGVASWSKGVCLDVGLGLADTDLLRVKKTITTDVAMVFKSYFTLSIVYLSRDNWTNPCSFFSLPSMSMSLIL